MDLRVSTFLRLTCIILIPLLFAAGCAKRDATKSLELAKQAQQEAQGVSAPRFAKPQYEDANKTLSAANKQFENGEYKQAIESAQRAQSRFMTAKDAVGPVKKRVQDSQRKVEEIIAACEKNVEDARKNNMKPEDVNPVASKVDGLKTKLNDEYVQVVEEEKWQALNTEALDVEKETKNLALAYLKPKAEEAKKAVQDLLTKAQELKADIHVPDKYALVTEQMKALDTLVTESKWQDVIDEASKMTQPISDIITSAQEKAAGDIVKNTIGLIEKAKQMGVADAPEFGEAIKQAENSIQSAQKSVDEKNYSAAITGTDDAKNFLLQAYKVLGEKAKKLIEESKANLQQAIDFEITKYAPSVLEKVQGSIKEIEGMLANEQYPAAFAASKQTLEASKKSIEAARSGKAVLALRKIEAPFAILKNQGGAQYAKEAYDSASSTIQELNEKMKAGQYDAVVEGVSPAVSVVDAAINELGQTASQYIEKADKAIQTAQKSGAQDCVPLVYKKAVADKQAALNDVNNKRFLAAIQKSELAISTAANAEAKSYQLRTDQNIRKADGLLAEAKVAGQQNLSPIAYSSAVKSRQDVLDLSQQGKSKEAFEKSNEFLQKADRALNNLVATAQEKTDSALKAESVKYSEQDIKKAMALLNEANEAQNNKNFAAANDKSQAAIKLAEDAEYSTWKERSSALIKKLDGVKERLEAQKAQERTPALYREAVDSLAEAKIKLLDADYKESYAFAAKSEAAENNAWDSMKTTLTNKAKDLTKTADWLGGNAMDQTGRELKLALMNSAAALNQQIDLRDWNAGYAAASQADKVSAGVIDRMEKNNRGVMAKKLREMLMPYEKKDAVSIVPQDEKLFKKTMETLSGKGGTYDEAYQNYQKSVESIDKLPQSIDKQAEQRTNEVANILQQAQDANVTKYFKDWYRELSSDLQWLRNSVRGNDYQGIASRLKKLEKEGPELLKATKLAIAEDNYLEALDVNIKSINELLSGFGRIAEMPKNLIAAARTTEHMLDKTSVTMYQALQGKLTAKNLRVNAEILEDRVKAMQPPESMKKVQDKAIRSFMYFRKAAEGFEIYGNSTEHDIDFRDRRLGQSYDYLYKVRELNDDLVSVIHNHRKLSTKEKVMQGLSRAEEKAGNFFFSFEAK